MENKQRSFRTLERFLSLILYADLALFIAYLVTAATGLIVLKIVFAVIAMLVAAFCEWMLYCTRELLKPRGLWLTCAFFSIILCTAVSLICNFPAP